MRSGGERGGGEKKKGRVLPASKASLGRTSLDEAARPLSLAEKRAPLSFRASVLMKATSLFLALSRLLPVVPTSGSYRKHLKSNLADLRNTGSGGRCGRKDDSQGGRKEDKGGGGRAGGRGEMKSRSKAGGLIFF